MSAGERNTDRSTDNPNQNKEQVNETLANLAQELNTPGTKIDKDNSNLSALNEKLQENKILPHCEILEMTANNDQLPGTGAHTSSVKFSDYGIERNATYNPDTKQLSFQQDKSLPDSKGPENVSIDMLSGKTTITAPGDESSKTTRTTTVPNLGDNRGTTVVTEGAPGETPGKVLSTEDSSSSSTSPIERKFDYDPKSGELKGFRSDGDEPGSEVKVPRFRNRQDQELLHSRERQSFVG